MQNLIDEISKLKLLKVNQVIRIYQGEDVVYLNRSISGYAVAIPFNDERDFDESFVGISLSTNYLNIEGESLKVLYLFMVDVGELEKFTYIAAEFVDIKNRSSLLQSPYQWIDTWRGMFGDAKKKFMITDILAELISLKVLYEKDKTAKWLGPKSGTHDIAFEGGVVEVKSTTSKKDSYISINSRFQIDKEANERIFLVRLELKPYAMSIDSIVEELVTMGYDSNELEQLLKEKGYKKGNRTRKISYNVLSINSYEVNEINFPVISLEDINNLTKSKNITGFKLTVDLSTIPGEPIL